MVSHRHDSHHHCQKMLLALPAEIIQLSVDNLDRDDLRSIRLVSRALYNHSLKRFSIAHFTTLRTDLTPRSLQKLQEVSDSRLHAPNVRCLQLCGGGGWFGEGHIWDRLPSGHLQPGQPGSITLKHLRAVKLVNCRSFRFDCPCDRAIQGFDGRKIPESPTRLTTSDVVSLIFSIVVEANLAIQSLVMACKDHSRRFCRGGLLLDTDRLPIDLSRRTKFSTACANLKEFAFEWEDAFRQQDWILHLISCCPNLQRLSLGLCRSGSKNFYRRFINDSLGSALVILRLDSASLHLWPFLTILLDRRATLRRLSLRNTHLKGGDRWSTTFAMLSQMPLRLLRLTRLSVFGLMGPYSRPDRYITTFPALELPETIPGSVREQLDPSLVPVSRWVESSGHRMKLKYKDKMKCNDQLEHTRFHGEPIGVSYRGSAMEEVLDILAKAAADVQRPNHWKH